MTNYLISWDVTMKFFYDSLPKLDKQAAICFESVLFPGNDYDMLPKNLVFPLYPVNFGRNC